MVSKPQRQERDGNYTLRHTLNDSDILNYSSKGSGFFCVRGKDINSHMTLHCICTEWSAEVSFCCQKYAQISTFLNIATAGLEEQTLQLYCAGKI